MLMKFFLFVSLALVFCSSTILQQTVAVAEQPTQVGQAADAARWENVSDEFFKQIEVHDIAPSYSRRCLGMAVAPTGEIFIVAGKDHGICVSRDQGATWMVVPGNNVTGRCESGFGFSMAYPYDGRLAFFCIDGTGGMTLDGGATWRPFGKLLRMLDYADVDWNEKDPQTVFGLLHEPYYTVLSLDGGKSWQQIYKDSENPNDGRKSLGKHYGVMNAGALLRSHHDQGGIAMSTDAGKSWIDVAKYQVLGRRPVHYGKKVFWTAAEGVVVSENGKDWTLTGKGPEKAVYGPYFGGSEQELMVVSEKAFSISRDGGKTWKDVAPAFFPPDGFRKGISANGSFNYFGWDAKNNLVYASGLGASVYRLKLHRFTD
jgi:photosystem II stability/assembly factor-like uncharacterized protein